MRVARATTPAPARRAGAGVTSGRGTVTDGSEAAVADVALGPDDVQPGGLPGARRVVHHVAAGVDPHVVGGEAEEDQVAGSRVRDLRRRRALRLGGTRDRLAGLPVDIAGEAGAVEAGRRRAAVAVVDARQAGGDAD